MLRDRQNNLKRTMYTLQMDMKSVKTRNMKMECRNRRLESMNNQPEENMATGFVVLEKCRRQGCRDTERLLNLKNLLGGGK